MTHEPPWKEHDGSAVCPVPAGHRVELEWQTGNGTILENGHDIRWLHIARYRDWTEWENQMSKTDDVPDFLSTLRKINGERAEAWLMGQRSDPLFWAVELGGEVGEILNVVKKLVREELGWRGSRATVNDLADEIADGIICLDSLARHYGIDLASAVTAKFNATSEKNGFSHRIDDLARQAVSDKEGV